MKKDNFKEFLEQAFIGENITGESGFVKILDLKNKYFEENFEIVSDIVSEKKEKYDENFEEEAYDFLYSFSKRYLSRHGGIYFTSEFNKSIVREKDVSLFWKTKPLYYVKTDFVWRDLSISDMRVGDKKFDIEFEVKGERKHNKNIDIKFKNLKNNKLILEVTKSSYGMSENKINKLRREIGIENLENKHLSEAIDIFKQQNEIDFFLCKKPYDFLISRLEKDISDKIQEKDSNEIEKILDIKEICEVLVEFVSDFERKLTRLWEQPRRIKKQGYVKPLSKIQDTNYLEEEKIVREHSELGIENSENLDKNCLPIDSKYVEKEAKSNFKNLLIKSENYQALLKILNEYESEVNCIYLDPPYNTSKRNFPYKDDYTSEGWLTMMSNRLELAKKFLEEDGVIFISIDDNEVHRLRVIMDDIFGEDNFIGTFVWKRRGGANDPKNNVSIDHEYVVCYSKNSEKVKFRGKKKEYKRYSNPDDDPRGEWVAGDLTCPRTREQSPGSYYEIEDPETGKGYMPNESRVWAYSKENLEKLIEENRVIFPDNTDDIPKLKRFKKDLNSEYKPVSTWVKLPSREDNQTNRKVIRSGQTGSGTRELKKLFGQKEYSYPKPIGIVKELIDQVTEDGDVVLDFFAGSGTTAQSVIELEREKDKKLNYILVEMKRKGYEISKKRIKKLMFSDDWKNGKSEEAKSEVSGFKYMELTSFEEHIEENLPNL